MCTVIDERMRKNVSNEAALSAEDVQTSLDAGMNSHIANPLVMPEVIKTIFGNLK